MTNSVLGVRNIQHTNGTDAMTLDTSGNVTVKGNLNVEGRVDIDTIPHALVGFTGNGNSYQSQSAGIIEFNLAVNNDGNHYDTSTYKFTCPVPGLYLMQFGTIAGSGTGSVGVDFYNNGTRFFRGWDDNRGLQCSTIAKVTTAGHQLHLQFAGNYTIYEGSGNELYTFGSYTYLG
tara:strand:- start:79 stop:603 length:525 start_codon:yes stop_codon:yes gene_type:complete